MNLNRRFLFSDTPDSEDSQPSDPMRCPVKDVQDFNIVVLDAINHNVGQARQDQLTGSFLPSGAAAIRRRTQCKDCLVDFKDSRLCKRWKVLG